MSANFEAKKVRVAEIVEKVAKAQSIVIIDYKGLTVANDTELRNRFRKAGVEYRVLKNTLFLRAAKENGIEGLEDYLNGTSSFAFGYDDPVAPAKVISDFIKEKNKTQIKGGVITGKVVNEAGVKALSELPPREVLIAKVLGTMNAPITGFVTVLSGTLRSLLYTLNAVKDQKDAQ